RKPGDVLSRGTRLLRLDVGEAVDDPSQVPAYLRPFAAISATDLAAATRKEFKFERTDGAWAINGRFADLEHALTTSVRNRGEIWHLDSGGGWAHPVHIHLEFMRILSRDGKLPPGWPRRTPLSLELTLATWTSSSSSGTTRVPSSSTATTSSTRTCE